MWLEIGFGGGEHLLWQAARNPEIGLIGCEPFEDGVVKVLSAIDSDRLTNIRVHADDARPMLRMLPEASVGRVFVLFPDPWPKKRHHKRRLVSRRKRLRELARILREAASCASPRTSANMRARYCLRSWRDGSFRWLAQGAEDWRLRPADWPQTRYEAKAVEAGRRCYFFRFQRISD